MEKNNNMIVNLIFSVVKQIILYTSFYGQTYAEEETYTNFIKQRIVHRYVYFTLCSLLLTTLVLILEDNKDKYLSSLYSFLLPNIFTYEIIVTLFYWSLFFTKKDLVLCPEGNEKRVHSVFLDLCQHVFPAIGLLICFLEGKFEVTITNYIFNFLFSVFYCLMIFMNYFMKGFFPYPFMDKMGSFKVLFAFCPLCFLFSSFLIKSIGRIGEDRKKKSNSKTTMEEVYFRKQITIK